MMRQSITGTGGQTMILIKCCANCENFDEDTCTVDCHCTTADDWCPRWEDSDGELVEKSR
jgi:hypothetical protein